MTKRTGAAWTGPLFAVLLTVSALAIACGSELPDPPNGPSPPPPTISSVTPSFGSTEGGAPVRITGTGLLAGVQVRFGSATVRASVDPRTGETAYVTTPRHPAGSVDVVVTNVDGQNGVAIAAYTFAVPESFDVDGNWRGVSFVGEEDQPFTFTVVNRAVVDMTCSTSGLVKLVPPAPIINGVFSFGEEGGVTVFGRIVAPNQANGIVNIGLVGNVRPCVDAAWIAAKH